MMASLTPLDLAALLCSRVCHDVISPVGAIVNGLEVLDGEQDEEMRAVAMELIKKSAVSASARLQFCRLAFGAAGSFGALIDTGDAEKVAQGMFVPRGGVIAVDISGEHNAVTMRVEAKGTNARLSHSATDFLTNAVPNEPIDGHSIQFYFTTLLARECQARLDVSTSPETVTLTVTPAPRIRDASIAEYSTDGSPAA
jgi:histidine phosphotransferase ChpT